MLRGPASKRLGGLHLTFHDLEQLLDMEPGSIQSIKGDPAHRDLLIVHGDEGLPIWDIADGAYIPHHRPTLKYIARMPSRKEKI